jgi:inward rectifier potassium channel
MTTPQPAVPVPPTAPLAATANDLGFGAVVVRESRRRLLNPDGSFTSRREGLSPFEALSPYHFLLTMSWGWFFGLLAGVYLVANTLFALGYLACGPEALYYTARDLPPGSFLEAFFFSVQTFATIGYGAIHPVGVPANILVTVESLVGIMTVALATGLMFARFSLARPRIRFSRQAVVAPYQGITGFMFRLTNVRNTNLINVECELQLIRWERRNGRQERAFYRLPLERDDIAFFTLGWTVVHPVAADSPLYGWTEERLRESSAEFLVLIRAVDDTLSQPVHVRTSYTAEEVRWGVRFRSLFNPPASDGTVSIDVGRLHDIEAV